MADGREGVKLRVGGRQRGDGIKCVRIIMVMQVWLVTEGLGGSDESGGCFLW